MCCWILFASILLMIFASIFISYIGLQFSFFRGISFSGFGIRVMVASENELENVPPSAIFWKSLRRIGVSSSLNVDKIHLWNHLALDFCLLEDFWSQFQVHCLWLVCSYFLFLPGSVLEGFTFLRICPFPPGCPFCWHIVACSSLLWSFAFLQCQL